MAATAATKRPAGQEARDERIDALFPKLSDFDISCLMPFGDTVALNGGEVIFREGEPASAFFVILEGTVRVVRRAGGDTILLRAHEAGEFTGEITSMAAGLPQIATGVAEGETKVLKIGIARFSELMDECPVVHEVILPAMVRRFPEASALSQQREKMAALGVLSAGLAHELNNPAAAARRGASQLRESDEKQMRLTLTLAQAGLLSANCDRMKHFRRDAIERAASAPRLDTLTRSDREDELTSWMASRDIGDAWEVAPALVEAAIEPAHLDKLAEIVPAEHLGDTVRWLECTLGVAGLIGEIEASTTRIADLVKAIKDYSYMDQGANQEIDIVEGIENTLVILSSKIHKGTVNIVRDYAPGLPKIVAAGSELNQVWTNLLDNALDAVDGEGTITLRVFAENGYISVEIIDDGPGIPPDVLPKVFDPFFTTKGVGKGTGLGLDISYKIVVHQHRGELNVTSVPGRTCFQVCIPLAAQPQN